MNPSDSNFATVIRKLANYLDGPSDFGSVSRAHLLNRLEADVHGFIAGQTEPTLMMVLNIMLDGHDAKEALRFHGFLDGA